ncbi:MAG: hypothetical protein LIP01_00165 [Tannerellaceae bacterium]|nr:hypothetical protein [Tannerellaceae bacterium]
MQTYQWGKYNTDWLVRDVPGMGNGLSAGLPDYPWFFSNDQAATFKGLLGARNPELFYNSWSMLKKISDAFNNHSGRIIHEVSTNGAVYDKGRMEESQEFIITAWYIYKWTGNIEFLRTYYEHGKKVWKFLQAHDTNNNLYVEGYGGTEIEGLNDEMLDVAVHTQTFLEVMAAMATLFDEPALQADYAEKAAILKKNINIDWWNPEENRYFDFRASKDKAIQLIDVALDERVIDGRNEWAKVRLQNLKRRILCGDYPYDGYSVFYNASTLSPLTAGIADKEKAIAALEEASFFTNKFGLYVAGIARPDDITLEESSVKHRLENEFNYNEAIMTAGTNSLALAECKYRGSEYALKYMHQIANNFSFATPGTTYEVSPDYGMFVQAWNICGINIPLIQCMFGVQPDAYHKLITLHPNIPSGWEYATLENLIIGNMFLSMDYKKQKDSVTWDIQCTEHDWTIDFQLPDSVTVVTVNDKPVTISNGMIRLAGKENSIMF